MSKDFARRFSKPFHFKYPGTEARIELWQKALTTRFKHDINSNAGWAQLASWTASWTVNDINRCVDKLQGKLRNKNLYWEEVSRRTCVSKIGADYVLRFSVPMAR